MTEYPTIWFLRHGETFWNVERRMQGQMDSDLTPKGIQHAEAQASLIEPILRADPPCFVSPLGRAQHTAEIALAGRSFQTDQRLSEAHAGVWQGLLRADVERDHPTIVDAHASALDVFLYAPESEGYEAFYARICAFLADLTEPSVIVSHGLLGQVLRGVICGLTRNEMGMLSNQQACVYVLEDGRETVLGGR